MVPQDPVNWSFVQHAVGDMLNEEEYQSVRILLPDGTTIEAVRMEKNAQGQWVLVANLGLEIAQKEFMAGFDAGFASSGEGYNAEYAVSIVPADAHEKNREAAWQTRLAEITVK